MAPDPLSRIKRATVEEIRPLLDPALLVFHEPSAEEQERFGRFEKLVLAEGVEADWAARRTAIEPIREILKEGPMGNTWNESDSSSTLFKGVKALAKWASGPGGDLSFAVLLTQRNREATCSLLHYLINSATESSLLRGLAREGRQDPDETKLRALLGLIEPAGATDPDLRQALLADIHYGILPGLADRITPATGKGGSKLLFWRMGQQWEEPAEDDWFGSYDPIATVRAVNPLLTCALRNVDSKPSTYDYSATKLGAEMLRGMPVLPSGKGFIADFRYKSARRKLDSIENSIGRAAGTLASVVDDVVRTSWLTRTHRELVRGLLAVRLYRRLNGRDPETLQAVVDAGLLRALPHDFLGEAPIRYDAKRGLIWSVGRDRLNSDGRFAAEANFLQSDFGYHLDERKPPQIKSGR